LGKRIVNEFQTTVGSQAWQIDELLLADIDREWTEADVAALMPQVKESAIHGHFTRLAGEDERRGRFLTRVRPNVFRLTGKGLPNSLRSSLDTNCPNSNSPAALR
jgi:hypothetical protein